MITDDFQYPADAPMALSGWRIMSAFNGQWYAEGYIQNDVRGRFPNGRLVNTSAISKVDLEKREIVTRNNTYKLL